MKITIHRGSDQIGGCITEYEENGWKLFIDYGNQLPGYEVKTVEIEGLNKGDISKSLLLITHYHNDHVGNIAELPDNLPIYMGELSKEILSELANHLSSVCVKEARMAKKLESVKTFRAGEIIKFGDFQIKSVTVDHSAFDAYAFKIESGKTKFFHTGDFRTHGFRSKQLFKMLEKYVGNVDYVVCEGTNIESQAVTNKSEHELQKEYEEAFKNNRGNIVYVSTANIDRIFSLYHAAMRAGRPFYVDPFQKRIMDIITQRENLWGKAELYQYGKYKPIPLKYDNAEYLYSMKFEKSLMEKGYVLLARATDRFDNLIAKIPGEKKKYLSQWSGYIDKSNDSYNPRLAKSVGDNSVYLHTSGHIDMPNLMKFFEVLKPKAIIPIHTDNPRRFKELFSEKWTVLLLKDGESFNPINVTR